MTHPNDGRFTWHELTTSDPARAASFYEALVGWKFQALDTGPGGAYHVFQKGDQQVAGGTRAQPGAPSAWLVYVSWHDPDAAVARVVEHGGKVIVPATTVPGMVRFAIAADPQGAAFGVVHGVDPSADDPLPERTPEAGTFCWDELYTTDQTAAGRFYGAVFGWTGKVGKDDPMKYWHWMNGGKDIGGMLDVIPPHAPPHWLPYLAVSDVDASTTRVRELGGRVCMEPMQIEKVGKFSVVADPTSAVFALFRAANV
jgi:predicted enzyme related to lactoylglutathione lyase